MFTCIHDGEDPSTLERLSHGGMPVDLPAGTAHRGRSGTAGAPDAGFPRFPPCRPLPPLNLGDGSSSLARSRAIPLRTSGLVRTQADRR